MTEKKPCYRYYSTNNYNDPRFHRTHVTHPVCDLRPYYLFINSGILRITHTQNGRLNQNKHTRFLNNTFTWLFSMLLHYLFQNTIIVSQKHADMYNRLM